MKLTTEQFKHQRIKWTLEKLLGILNIQDLELYI